MGVAQPMFYQLSQRSQTSRRCSIQLLRTLMIDLFTFGQYVMPLWHFIYIFIFSFTRRIISNLDHDTKCTFQNTEHISKRNPFQSRVNCNILTSHTLHYEKTVELEYELWNPKWNVCRLLNLVQWRSDRRNCLLRLRGCNQVANWFSSDYPALQ